METLWWSDGLSIHTNNITIRNSSCRGKRKNKSKLMYALEEKQIQASVFTLWDTNRSTGLPAACSLTMRIVAEIRCDSSRNDNLGQTTAQAARASHFLPTCWKHVDPLCKYCLFKWADSSAGRYRNHLQGLDCSSPVPSHRSALNGKCHTAAVSVCLSDTPQMSVVLPNSVCLDELDVVTGHF